MSSPPLARREEVVEVLHGVEVPDPYRWLEDGSDPEVRAWVAAQNRHTREALDARPDRAWWHERLVALMQLPVVASVQQRGPDLLCLERAAGSEQFVLTRRSAVDPAAPPTVLLDPAGGSADATTAIDWYATSEDGSLVAVGVSDGGTEDSVLRVLRAVDGTDTGEAIPSTRACSVAWEPDGSGFFYTRYPPGDQYHRSVHHHRLGSDSEDDPLVWSDPDEPTAWPTLELSPDGRHLLVSASVGWARFDHHLLDRDTGSWTTLIAGRDVTSTFEFAPGGTSLVGVTTLDAPRGRLVRVPLGEIDPARWQTLVAEGAAVLGHPVVAGDQLLVVASEDAVDTILRFGLDGEPLGAVTGAGDAITVNGITADRHRRGGFAVVDAFRAPTSVWHVGPDGTASRWWPPAPAADAVAPLTVTRTSYPSLDGTTIGLFLIHRTDVPPGPAAPAILNGYGGFAIAETPAWSPSIAAWCAAGGTYAIAGLRGGYEHGEPWHHAGRREHKQRVFDDFHAAADWLVERGFVDRQRLAVLGRSNGGLLVGVAMTQRPDLCRAVWCGVPLLDMIRFPQFLIAQLWTSEYGDPDVADEFAWLRAYSPYHHVVDGTCYPATLFSTAEGDTRVDPLHARKMAAFVQAATSCGDERPILLHQEGRAGHGVGKPVAKRADELADGLSFLAGQLDVHVDGDVGAGA